MSTQVVVTLPDDLYAQAQHWAALTHREVPQLLTEALALVLTPIGAPPGDAPPIATLSDTEVLALTQVQMPPQRYCRKVRFLGQNPKIGYQKFNDLQNAKLSKKQRCDRTRESA
jgi:hypothetical protein